MYSLWLCNVMKLTMTFNNFSIAYMPNNACNDSHVDTAKYI